MPLIHLFFPIIAGLAFIASNYRRLKSAIWQIKKPAPIISARVRSFVLHLTSLDLGDMFVEVKSNCLRIQTVGD